MSKLQQETATGSGEARMSFSKDTGNYDAIRESYGRNVEDNLRQNPLKEGATIVDLGAGTGLLGLEYLKRGYKVIFVDPNEGMLTKCKVNVDAYLESLSEGDRQKLPKPEFKLNQADKLSQAADKKNNLGDSIADLIVSGDSAHWWNEKSTANKEIFRIGKEDAKMLFIWRQPDRTNDLVKIIDKHLEAWPSYKGARGRFVMEDSRMPESVARQFIDGEGIKVVADDYTRKMTPDQMIMLTKSWAATTAIVSEPANEKEFREFLVNKVDDPEGKGTIPIAWTVTTVYGSPKKVMKAAVKTSDADTQVEKGDTSSWVARSGSPRAHAASSQLASQSEHANGPRQILPRVDAPPQANWVR